MSIGIDQCISAYGHTTRLCCVYNYERTSVYLLTASDPPLQSGLTPLHVASFMGCMNIVIYLLQHDAKPNHATVRGETPLHLAARANQADIIRILLRNRAEVDARARVRRAEGRRRGAEGVVLEGRGENGSVYDNIWIIEIQQ